MYHRGVKEWLEDLVVIVDVEAFMVAILVVFGGWWWWFWV